MRASVAVAVFALSFSVVAQEQRQELTVKVGESIQLSAKGFNKISVADDAIAAVAPGDDMFTVSGVRAGTTRILTWRGEQRQEYVVTVTGSGVATPPAAKSASAALTPDERITMKVGESRVLIVPDIKRVSVGDPEIADISLADKEQLLLEAKTAGRTLLLHWDANGARRVTEITVQ